MVYHISILLASCLFLLVGGIPGKWPPRAVSSSPTKLLQMSIINKMKADARYDNFYHGGGINRYLLFVNVKCVVNKFE